MTPLLAIPSTLAVIKNCWEGAEEELRQVVRRKYHDLEEETITTLFHREFRLQLNQASDSNGVSRAFLDDLERAFPQLVGATELGIIAENLFADVSLHPRRIEGRTGADFGFTINRPQVSVVGLEYGCPKLNASEQQFGLLSQAKMNGRSGKWNNLKKGQQRNLATRMSYLALLLYQYDDNDRKVLAPFHWQVCRDWAMLDLTNWLKSGRFPSRLSSLELIDLLGEGRIGTGDPQLIERYVRPTGKPQFSIVISWPAGKQPPHEQLVYLSGGTVDVATVNHEANVSGI